MFLNKQIIAYDYTLIKHKMQMSSIPRTWGNWIRKAFTARTKPKTEKGTEISYTAWFIYFHFPLEDNIRLFVWFLLAGNTLFWYVKMPAYKWEASHAKSRSKQSDGTSGPFKSAWI